jgi:hypothetical protein
VTALNLAGSVARFGLPHLSMEALTWNSVLGTSFFVGFIEEIPYRGFMLQKFTERLGFGMATDVDVVVVCRHSRAGLDRAAHVDDRSRGVNFHFRGRDVDRVQVCTVVVGADRRPQRK